MAAMQRKGGTVALIDAEHAFDPVYAASLGLNARDMILTQPDSGEMALEVVDRLVRSSSVDVIAVDSVAALVPQAEIEGEIGLVQVGSQARLMSQALRKLAANASRGQCTIIFLNQLRSKIGVIYGSPEVTSGGNALKFYASVRMDIRKIAQIPDKAAESQTGIRCKVKVVKNKVAPPYRQAEFDIMFGSGISHLGCVVDAAESTGVLVRKGSWYSYKETNLGQGREKTMAALAEDPALAAEIEAAVRASGAFASPIAAPCKHADARACLAQQGCRSRWLMTRSWRSTTRAPRRRRWLTASWLRAEHTATHACLRHSAVIVCFAQRMPRPAPPGAWLMLRLSLSFFIHKVMAAAPLPCCASRCVCALLARQTPRRRRCPRRAPLSRITVSRPPRRRRAKHVPTPPAAAAFAFAPKSRCAQDLMSTTWRVRRWKLMSCLQDSQVTSSWSLLPSTVRMSPKNAMLLTPQLGHGACSTTLSFSSRPVNLALMR